MDNSENRLNDVFFYGLYMDPDVLKAKGVIPRNPRKAVAKGHRLRIGNMATLLREPNAEAYGIVYQLTHDEVYRLYWGSGLDAYVAEAIVVETESHDKVVALCCNLLTPPAEGESNPEYLQKLTQCMHKYGVRAPST
ncbi:MAG: gamma-glutamylcyclotransferase [Candidatus Thiodiazotropha sp.]